MVCLVVNQWVNVTQMGYLWGKKCAEKGSLSSARRGNLAQNILGFTLVSKIRGAWILISRNFCFFSVLKRNRKSTRLNSSHMSESRMPSSA